MHTDSDTGVPVDDGGEHAHVKEKRPAGFCILCIARRAVSVSCERKQVSK